MAVGPLGIIFFVWIGIFNVLVVTQFWGFANDLYTEEEGKRLFPLIAFGATLGGVSGSRIAEGLTGPLGVYKMMLVSAAVLLIAVYNFINATGEYIINDVSQRAARQALQAGTAGGLGMEQIIGKFFAEYQLLANLLALVIQLFLVSRIFKWVGVGGALLFLPAIALGGYGYIAFGASLMLVKWVKSLENGTDYSLMNTTKAALFLITPREEKYKAKAAIDTFFVRGGDALAALSVFVGTTYFSLAIERYAIINVVMVAVWIGLCVLIAKEYKKLKSRGLTP